MGKPVFKLFCLLLCVFSLLGCGQRQEGKTSESQTQELISYEIGDTEVTVANCDDKVEGEVVIPDGIQGLPVTSIGDRVFSECSSLTSITIPKAFHSYDEAKRLGLDKLWPDDFSLPVGTSK